MTQTDQDYDTSIRIVTPENIAFEHRVAGPFQRVPAYAMDLLIRLGVIAAAAIVLGCAGLLSGIGLAPLFIAYFVLDWFYGGVFEAYWNGQTPGKRMMRLRVVSFNGQPINGLQAVLRNVLRTADMLPAGALPLTLGSVVVPIPFVTFQFALIAMALNNRYQRLGDLAAGTMVVIEEPQRLYGVVRVTEPEAIRLAGEIPVGFRVSRTLAMALSNYVQRRQSFSWPRRAEIARHLAEPLRQEFHLPPDTSHDLLLCALYHRTFIADDPGQPAKQAGPFVNTAEAVT